MLDYVNCYSFRGNVTGVKLVANGVDGLRRVHVTRISRISLSVDSHEE